MKFFRIYGVGNTINNAFNNAVLREKDIHTDLSNYLTKNKYNVHSIINKKKSSSELEYLILMYSLSINFKENRDLTHCEEQHYNEFYNLYDNHNQIHNIITISLTV